MITYDLRCSSAHIFEGWFASSDAYNVQLEAGQICCPVCGDGLVTKALSAPFVGRKSNQAPRVTSMQPAASEVSLPQAVQDNAVTPGCAALPVPVSDTPNVANAEIPAAMAQLIEKMASVQAEILENSQWVGRKFADEARAIHYGETQARQIHGEASLKEAEDLAEEGINIAALPLPFIPPESKN